MATGGKIKTNTLSDEPFDVLCSMCKNRGKKKSEGEKFCVDCNDYFCIKCVKVHSQVPLCAGHKLLDIAQVKSGTSKGLPRASAERCDRHSHKHIDMYCQNHDNVCCSTCIATDHRSCKNTFYIPEFIQNNSYQVASGEIQTKLKVLARTLAVQANKFQQDKQSLLKRKAELLDDIKKYRQEINNQLDKLEKSSIHQIEYKFKLLEDTIEEGLRQLQAHKTKVTLANDKLVSPNPNQAELFVHVKMGENAENVAYKCIDDTKMKISADYIEFQPDRYLLQQLKQKKTIGMLRQKTAETDDLIQIEREQAYYAIVDSYENKSHIISACYMDNGTLILADQTNSRLKRLDSHNYAMTGCYVLSGIPWEICKINEAQVAVTLTSKQEVHFISVDTIIIKKNKIKTGINCRGLAYANNHLYISDISSVYIYTMSGRKLKEFSSDQSGEKLFANITSLAVSKDETRIYVAEYDKGLIVLDSYGQIVKFNGDELKMATCCHVTEAGSVLVCASYDNHALQYTSGGELIGSLIESADFLELQSICCNQQMSKMCISRRNYDHIEVYDI